MRQLHPRSLVAVCAVFKLIQFMDRGVQNGSPIEFDVFIQRTTNTTAPAAFFGFLGTFYTTGTVIGCVATAVLLSRSRAAHGLMLRGMLTSGVGMIFSACGYWMPSTFATFAFSFFRARPLGVPQFPADVAVLFAVRLAFALGAAFCASFSHKRHQVLLRHVFLTAGLSF